MAGVPRHAPSMDGLAKKLCICSCMLLYAARMVDSRRMTSSELPPTLKKEVWTLMGSVQPSRRCHRLCSQSWRGPDGAMKACSR